MDSAVSSSTGRSVQQSTVACCTAGWNPSGATTVVAVHGITANHRTFALLAEALPEHRLLARSSGSGSQPYLAGAVGDRAARRGCRRADHRLSSGPVVLVGHSMGGFVAAALVRRSPDLVSGLVLVDGGLPSRRPRESTWTRPST